MDASTARKLLETERDRLARMARAEREAVARDGQSPPGDDAGAETLELECDVSILHMVDERMADVTSALDKLAAGTYGACETCGAPISDERLRARPEARFCERDERTWEQARQASDSVVDPGWAELALLPDDVDDVDERLPLSPEQAALHAEDGEHRLTALEIEEMEARISDELAVEDR